ncbi:MAG: hypothetical protein ACTSPI_04205 [Candidatus Heimdallarchaeaceae archaeon]
MIEIKWNVASINKVINNLEKLKEGAITEGTKEGLLEVTNNIMAESRWETPFRTGTLQSTAAIDDPEVTEDSIHIHAGYAGRIDKRNPETGDLTSEYAEKVHDIPGTPPGGGNYHPYGKWKFLSDPFQRQMLDFLAKVTKYVGIRVRRFRAR